MEFGGANCTGFVFSIDPPTGTVTVLHNFPVITDLSSPHYSTTTGEGAQPIGTLVEGLDRNLYGTTLYGGRNGGGTIFEMTKDGTSFVTLYEFPKAVCSGYGDPDHPNGWGVSPYAGLIQSSNDGSFYGTTYEGGVNRYGTVFKMRQPNTFAATLNADPSTVYTSETIRVAALPNNAVTLSIAGGTYSINGGSFRNSSCTIRTGDSLAVRVTSSSSYNTRVLGTLSFSGVGNSSYGVTTKSGP
jgi:uncharacterized repeat protein (TIGR03803 family)